MSKQWGTTRQFCDHFEHEVICRAKKKQVSIIANTSEIPFITSHGSDVPWCTYLLTEFLKMEIKNVESSRFDITNWSPFKSIMFCASAVPRSACAYLYKCSLLEQLHQKAAHGRWFTIQNVSARTGRISAAGDSKVRWKDVFVLACGRIFPILPSC